MSVGDHTRFDREFDRRYAYGGCDLGAVCTPDRTVFKLWSPEASGVELFLYRHDTAGPWFDRRPLELGTGVCGAARWRGTFTGSTMTMR